MTEAEIQAKKAKKKIAGFTHCVVVQMEWYGYAVGTLRSFHKSEKEAIKRVQGAGINSKFFAVEAL